MMDHAQYRSALITDPNDPNPELLEHRHSCAECAAWTERLLRFESRLTRALKIDVAGHSAEIVSLGERAAQRRGPASTRWMALAASVLLAVVVSALWIGLPDRSLAAEVATHVADEPESWQHPETAVPEPNLDAVLRDSKVELLPRAGRVSYANSCDFRGHVVPHLVVQSAAGAVTVMVLVHERARKLKSFDEQGYRGVIVPMKGHGSIAVLMKDSNAEVGSVEQIAATVRDSVVYTD